MTIAGCAENRGSARYDVEADTAEFTWGGRTATVGLTECGRDGDVVVLAGADDGMVVQAAADFAQGGLDRTGVTGDMGGDDGIWGAFGPELPEGPAGEVTAVEIFGDQVTIEGTWVRFDEDLVPDPTSEVDGKLVARCPENGG